MKILFDTNVYIGRVLAGGAAKEAIRAVVRARWRIYTSEYILSELERVVCEKLGRSVNIAKRARQQIEEESQTILVGSSRHRVPRDPKDDAVLATAVRASVDYLVTNDEDLLSLDPYEGVRILSLRSFRQILREHGLL